MLEPSQQHLSPIVVLKSYMFWWFLLVGAILPYLVETSNKKYKTDILAVADLHNVRSPSAILQSHVIGKLVSIWFSANTKVLDESL